MSRYGFEHCYNLFLERKLLEQWGRRGTLIGAMAYETDTRHSATGVGRKGLDQWSIKARQTRVACGAVVIG